MSDAPASKHPRLRLDQFLKLRRLAGSGGQAKWLIQGGEVSVNGQVETSRGRQLQVGDVVAVQGVTLVYDGSSEA